MTILSLLLFSACSDEHTTDSKEQPADTAENTSTNTTDDTASSETDSDDAAAEPSLCDSLSPEDCRENPACTTLAGSPVFFSEDNECMLWANTVEELGCMDADEVCAQAFSYGAAPDDPTQCYGFGNSCTPYGWANCNPQGYPECD